MTIVFQHVQLAFVDHGLHYSLLISCTFAIFSFLYGVFQAGHVTKSGDIAGPRVLEHIVDAVLYMEVGTLIQFFFFTCLHS